MWSPQRQRLQFSVFLSTELGLTVQTTTTGNIDPLSNSIKIRGKWQLFQASPLAIMYNKQWHLHIGITLRPCIPIIIVSPRPSYSHSLDHASPISQAFLDNTFRDRIIARLQCLRRLGDIRNQLAETLWRYLDDTLQRGIPDRVDAYSSLDNTC